MSQHTPILYLPFDTLKDGACPNLGGLAVTATVYGATLVVDPLLGPCFNFDGVDDYVSLPEMTIDYSQGFTVSAWVHYESFQQWSRIIDFGNGAGQANILLANKETGNQLTLLSYSAILGYLDAPNALTLKQWVHVSATIGLDGTGALYLNGQVIQQGQLSMPASTTRRKLYVGRSNWDDNGYFHGKMARLRVYNRGLSAAEIRRDMDNTRLGLAAYLKLDDLADQRAPDSSQNGFDGRVQGAPQLLPDDTFGSCLSFDGVDDAIVIDLDQPETEATHMLWFKTTAANGGLLSATNEQGDQHDRHTYLQRGQLTTRVYQKTGDKRVSAGNLALADGKWHHVAHVFGTSVRGQQLYVDGQLIQGEGDHSDFDGQRQIRLGFSADSSPAYFSGQLAHVRLYRRALSAAEIEQAQAADKLGMAPFRKSHPIAFSLRDKADHYAIYIDDDPADQTLILELHNTAGRTLVLRNGAGGAASPGNYHLALRFRPGTLSAATFKQLQCLEKKEWDLCLSGEGGAQAGPATVYLLYTGQNRDFAADERRTITLQHISAAPEHGARGTLVELLPNQIGYQDDPFPITGSRVAHLSVINHQGKQQIPLHLGFVGSNTILNDGSTNSRTVRLMNTSAADTLVLTPASRLVLSFDTQAAGEQKDWALGTDSQVRAIGVAPLAGWSIEEPTQGQAPEWILTPAAAIGLKPGAAIQITLQNIVTSHPSGPANLYLGYQNIPGYWDGQFICSIEKTPLIYRGGHVGLGVVDPNKALTITHPSSETNNANVEIRGAGNHSWGVGLVMRTTGGIDGPAILFRSRDQKNWQVRGETNGAGFQITEDGGDGEYGSGHGTPRLHLSAGGKLGLGTTNPQASLHVFGGQVRIDDGATGAATDAATRLHVAGGNVRIDGGKLGVGVPNPSEKLEVDGTVVARNLALSRDGQTRGALFFATPGDTNHTLYNNVSNIDGEGPFDGVKWNTGQGLSIRTGWNNAKKPALSIDDAGNTRIHGAFTVQSGQAVTGIPIVDFQQQQQGFSQQKGGSRTLRYTFTFGSAVQSAQAMLGGWWLEYDRFNREQVARVGVEAAVAAIAGNTVYVDVTFDLRDSSGNYDDAYNGRATVVVVARLSQAL